MILLEWNKTMNKIMKAPEHIQIAFKGLCRFNKAFKEVRFLFFWKQLVPTSMTKDLLKLN